MEIENSILKRSGAQCELCSSISNLAVYDILPEVNDKLDCSILLCDICFHQVSNKDDIDPKHWHCLNGSMWSEYRPVQVMAYRMLKHLSNESWALDLFDQLYLDDETKAWADEGVSDPEDSDLKPTLDSNGALLKDGDTVSLIKDLVVKGANFTAKRGTIVKKISLTDNPAHIEGRVNGTQIVLLTCFLKKQS